MISIIEMTENTINTDMTMGGATGALLAGRYRVVRQLGRRRQLTRGGWCGNIQFINTQFATGGL